MTPDANFKAVVLGDSVMWGQGLHEQDKIHNLVAAGLAEQGLIVHTILKAHSGAVIGEPDVNTGKPPIDGEVPVGEPTVFEQIESVLEGKAQDDSVNLVMICAGVNDVDITRILSPVVQNLTPYIEDAFCRKLRLVMERVYHCFPNALIIIAGYYKAFSADSEHTIILNVLKGLGITFPILPNTVGGIVIDVLGPRLTQALIDRSESFRDTAHNCIQSAIVDIVGIMPEAKARIYFADPKFKDENAVGASQPFLYGINADFTPQDPPDIVEARAKACETYADRLNTIEKFAGPRASVAHPNALGARQYADVILANIRFALPSMFVLEPHH